MNGCFRATHEPDERSGRPFAPDALFANAPAFAGIHLAEALGSQSTA
jgi:sterol 3beta-glucosyltransferase